MSIKTLLGGAARAALLAATVMLSVACSTNGSAQQPPQAAPEVRLVINVPVEGMSCMSCVARITRALQAEPGVAAVDVSLEQRNARVEYVEGRTTPERIAQVISSLGYTVGAPVAVP